jgi:N-acetylglucosamine kinase-like BadF-type ATPase
MERFVVGVDGGTTKTIALVSDLQGHILGAARAGGTNCVGTVVEGPMAVVAGAIRQALDRAGVTVDQVAVAVCCLAGADWPEDHVARQQALQAHSIARRVVVKNDTFAGLRAGTTQPWGVVIAAGTATNTAAIAPDGREWAFGYYEDGGGAGDVARAAVRAVLRQEDGRGEPTLLTKRVLAHLGLPSAEALLRALLAKELPAGRIYGLCPLVFTAACDGDRVARNILTQQGACLADYAVAIIRRFDMAGLAFDVVLSGSLFKGEGPLLVDTITHAIHAAAPGARIVRAQREPAVGAVLLALDAADAAVSDECYANLDRSVPEPAFFSTLDGGTLSRYISHRAVR